ncbi:hypothetical protein [Peptoniphilus rhinitidis]|uniref:hypothetical protein n=1 Tax=Peptoniphilus rhinitidis TaxID=1175452 RepID=UPI000287E6ED|nr:hypothetical protein [Peptoniphilus rhinitidis]
MKKDNVSPAVILNDEINSNLEFALKSVINEWYFLEDMQEIICNEQDNENYKRQKCFEYFYKNLKDYLFVDNSFLMDLMKESTGETY